MTARALQTVRNSQRTDSATETGGNDQGSDDSDLRPMLSVRNLVKSYGSAGRRRRQAQSTQARAVDDVSFEVYQGELFTLLGPSGCGKTTTLRSIAGLERPEGGTIAVGGRLLYDAAQGIECPVNERGLGMVFQSYAIWPHMTVFKNVAYPLRVTPRKRRPSADEIARRVRRVLEVTELSHLEQRPATNLSGGQQQRLALARALVVEPPLLLLDEPLSNLDAKLRESMRFELKRLQQELGLTSIYVTHDQSEALAMSSRLAVMKEGKVVQVGKPREIYERPANRFVADFIGVTNFLPGIVTGGDNGYRTVSTEHGEIHFTCDRGLVVGSSITLAIRPEGIRLTTAIEASHGMNYWLGRVQTTAYMGDSVEHVVNLGEATLRNRSNPGQSLAPGTEVAVEIDMDQIGVLPEAEERV